LTGTTPCSKAKRGHPAAYNALLATPKPPALEHELFGGQGADKRLLACLLVHAGLLSPGPLVDRGRSISSRLWAAGDGTAIAAPY
jgi:hypothetical protein